MVFQKLLKGDSRPSTIENNQGDLDSVDDENVVASREQFSSISVLLSNTNLSHPIEQQEDKEVENASHLQMATGEDHPVILIWKSDPELWPECISDTEVNCLLKADSASPMYNFDLPTYINKHMLTSNNSTRYLSKGEKINRNWLVHPVAKDLVFCFYSKFFLSSQFLFHLLP